jgi:cellobiose phosphorylase
MVAETILGNGNRAYEYYRQINPGDKNDQIDEYECEPYVYAQNILGDEHPEFGLARNSWLSGTASWVYQAAMLYILGIRPTYHGLLIDPCIPDRWDGFKARRKFRNTWFEIEVHNPNHIQRGIQRLIVDGQDVSGGLLTDIADKPVSHVQAWMS